MAGSREQVERFDEAYEDWLMTLSEAGYVDMNLMPAGTTLGSRQDVFQRSLDPDMLTFHLRGVPMDLRRFSDACASSRRRRSSGCGRTTPGERLPTSSMTGVTGVQERSCELAFAAIFLVRAQGHGLKGSAQTPVCSYEHLSPTTITRHRTSSSCSNRMGTSRNRRMIAALVFAWRESATVRKESPPAKAIGSNN